jgi:GNAT superfamily N-acetyltransferase
MGYLFTTDKALIPVAAVHKWISEQSYWAKNIPFDVLQRSFDNSYTMGILKDDELVGFGRFVTDYATFAYLADVYVTEPHRGQGLSKKMMELLLGLDWVQGLRGIMLGTRDAQGLYAQFGFVNPEFPERIMQIRRAGIYGDLNSTCT